MPAKKKRGRPKGSKNKTKQPIESTKHVLSPSEARFRKARDAAEQLDYCNLCNILLDELTCIDSLCPACDSITGSNKNYEPINSEQFRGCPVCRIGKEFEGGAHKCNICQKFIHPWCGISEEEGSGKGITCNNCS